MNNFVSSAPYGKAVKLTGVITKLRSVRSSANFVYSVADQDTMGVVAIAAALAGMGGQAAAIVANASNMEESADYLEFDLNGDPVKGWVWRSPFKEGDVVDVAAEWRGDCYEAYGIARPTDRTIALYPHCSRSKRRHIRNAIKWWAICSAAFFAAMLLGAAYIGGTKFVMHPSIRWTSGGIALAFVPMFVSLSKQFMPFVRVSEKVFDILGLPHAKDMDLVESSKQQRTTEDPAEFGTFYFRY